MFYETRYIKNADFSQIWKCFVIENITRLFMLSMDTITAHKELNREHNSPISVKIYRVTRTNIYSRVVCVSRMVLCLLTSLEKSEILNMLINIKYLVNCRNTIDLTLRPVSVSDKTFILRSRNVRKLRGWQFKSSNHFDIWHAPQQQCCPDACLMSVIGQ